MIEAGWTIPGMAGFLSGQHRQEDKYKLALYTESAALDRHTKEYSSKGEILGDGYHSGGVTLENWKISTDADGVYFSFDPPEWPRADITGAVAALIYNTRTKLPVMIMRFNLPQTSINGRFRIKMPPPGTRTALFSIIR